ncbi:hypothetical protein ACOMHN_014105 [Nucella lapillus]
MAWIEHWVTLVPENPKIGTLYGVVVANDKLVIYYVSDAKYEVFIHNRQTGVQEKKVDLDLGSLFCLAGKVNDSEVFYGFKSFLTPGTVYRLDMTNYKSTVFTENQVSGFNRDDFVIKQEFFNSKDGTRVPMFIVHRKNLQRTGKHPVLMYGYGGFDYSLTPYFRASTTVFLQHMEGIYVLVNIRGGGEYGVEWHKNGSLGNKQNGLDDFQAAAEYLITQNYTNSKKLAIEGSSNGGLLVGACLNQRPDLFASGIIGVGLGFSLSYNEVKLFEMCAAVQQGTDLVGVDPKTSWIQFAADNVDHQIRTLDGTGTFHGMGIIGAATPGTKECRAVRRDTSVTPDRISALGRVPGHFYNPSSVDLSLVYEILQDFAVEDRTRKLDLLWKVSWPLRSPRLGWSGMMQNICSGAYPGKSSFTFLPMIDMDPTNMSCIFSTLHFVSSVASRLLDMLRYHLFTIGHAWIPEYGSVDIKDEFLWVYGYSPLHNIPSKPKGGQYPSTLLLTADKDDRVVPLHSYKFIATLQYKIGNNPQQTNPLIIRVDTNTGHGAGKPVSKQIEETTDIYSFLYRTLELSWSK